MADIALLWLAIAQYTNSVREVDRPAAALRGHYLLWVTYASRLNAEIVRRNR